MLKQPIDRRRFLVGAAATAAASAAAGTLTVPAAAGENATPAQPAGFGVAGRDFPQVGGNLANHNHSTLDQITRRSVGRLDRKSTRLNSSHSSISYAVFCL